MLIGFDVHVATEFTKYKSKFKKIGFIYPQILILIEIVLILLHCYYLL